MKFNWHNPYLTTRTPLFARNAVATSHPLAAHAGNQALLNGGNAVDAAIAAAATLTIVEPVSNGLGSDAFAMVWDGEQLHGLNASGTAPSHWDTNWFARRYGVDAQGHAKRPVRGWDSVTIPGAVAAWEVLHQRFGKLPFSQLLETAIDLAERGVTIAPMVARKWHAAVPLLQDQPGFAATFMPNGRAPEIGEKFVMPAAARTLRLLADQGARAFYEGEAAEAIVRFAAQSDVPLTLADLAGYRPEWVTPVSRRYRGYDVHELPPNGQGIAALIALGILEHFDLASLPLDSVASQHLQVEAMKLAFADIYKYVGDPRSMDITPEQMLDDSYLAERARLIDPARASQPLSGMPASGGTVYLTTADESGMMVSFIQSNYMGFGSGVVVPETGISLQNRGCGFVLDPKHPNALAGSKRPFHTIIPGFAMGADGKPLMSFGVMGGPMQAQGHMQMALRIMQHGQNPQAAIDAPRWRVVRGREVIVESTFSHNVIAALRDRGHQITVEDPQAGYNFGGAQVIYRMPEGQYVAATESRKDGQALVS